MSVALVLLVGEGLIDGVWMLRAWIGCAAAATAAAIVGIEIIIA